MKKKQGFTLIEVMIVVVIVAVLAAIAVPSYRQNVLNTNRSDATSTLTQIAGLQERYFFQNNRYFVDNANLATFAGSANSFDGNYVLAIANPCGDATCYTLTATAIGSQLNDTACRQFAITHTGRKSAQDSNSADTTDVCW